MDEDRAGVLMAAYWITVAGSLALVVLGCLAFRRLDE
jgi:hypothetical protein